jgi:hypothetical protein
MGEAAGPTLPLVVARTLAGLGELPLRPCQYPGRRS